MNLDAYTFAVAVYGPLQVASLLFLPKWWRVAAVPALWVVVEIILERNHPSYMSDVLIAIPILIGYAYLVLVWIVVGITSLIQRSRKPSEDQR